MAEKIKKIRRDVAVVSAAVVAAASISGEIQARTAPVKALKPAATRLLLRGAERQSSQMVAVRTPAAYAPSDFHPEKLAHQTLRTFEQLPGWGMKVTAAQKQKLERATALLNIQSKDGLSAYLCSTFAIEPGIFETAAHCGYPDKDTNWNGTMPAGVGIFTSGGTIDYLKSPDNGFYFSIRGRQVQAFAMTPLTDTGLLKTLAIEGVQPIGTNRLAFDKPVVGQQVFRYGYNHESGKMQGGQPGIFVGRIRQKLNKNPSDNRYRMVDATVFAARTPQEAQCIAGGSGSSGGALADGRFLGDFVQFSMRDEQSQDTLDFRQWVTSASGVAIPDNYNLICISEVPNRSKLTALRRVIS